MLMGIDYSTYIGPYVVCAVQRHTTTDTWRSCPLVACVNYGKYMQPGFCPHCGTQIMDVAFPVVKDTVDDGDIREQIDERLATASGDDYQEWARANSAHLWMPNTGGIGRHLDSREAFSLHRITATDIHNETHAFEGYFAAELAQLRAAYGEAAVSVRWGVIQDYS